MKRSLVFCVTIVVSLVAKPAEARIIHVPADSSSIQAGINGAVDGDTVLVARGRYYERITIPGKAVLLASNFILDGDPAMIESTVIDAENGGSVVVAYSGPGGDPTIQGFTITNGHASVGGGIFSQWTSTPIIKDNIITGNSAVAGGGGIGCDMSSAMIVGNVISNNSAGLGGGIYLFNSWWSVIAKNIIVGNSSVEDGGGIGCFYSSPPISRNTIAFNTALGEHGGGIWCYDNSSPEITNNTIVGNSAPGMGGAIIGHNYCSPVITNNIISHSRDGGGIAFIYSNPVVRYNDFWNEGDGNFYGCPAGVGDTSWGVNFNGARCDSFYNIIRDPLFADTIDFELLSNSPCIDAGDPNLYVAPDSGGCRVDIGAHEYFYVLGDANSDSSVTPKGPTFGGVSVGDVVFLINYLYKSGAEPSFKRAADPNCDGEINVADVVCLVNYLFRGQNLPC